MSCVTHHHACECREAKIREMCEYVRWAAREGLDAPSGLIRALEAADMIASELYGERSDDAAAGESGRQQEARLEAPDR